jgi:histidinol phosphatase-like enzyme (inositol monophosphatase family)
MDPTAAAEYLEFAYEAAQAAGAAILPHFRASTAVNDKRGTFGYDPVTLADRSAEAAIRAAIRTRYPTHGFVGEESGREAGSSPLTWVIDPIDGTKSFILGQLHWATLIALHDGTQPVVGIAHQPFVGETFLGMTGGFAQWRRGSERRDLRTRPCPRIEDALVATTDPRYFRTPREVAALATVSAAARLTRYGGDCYCYTQLAMGQTDVVIETGLQPYDVQALMPIIQGAGGIITDWQGGPCDQGGDVLACGDPALHRALLARLAVA